VRHPRCGGRSASVGPPVCRHIASADATVDAAPGELRGHRRTRAAGVPSKPLGWRAVSAGDVRRDAARRGTRVRALSLRSAPRRARAYSTARERRARESDPIRRAPRAERGGRNDLRRLLALTLQVRGARLSLRAARGRSRGSDLPARGDGAVRVDAGGAPAHAARPRGASRFPGAAAPRSARDSARPPRPARPASPAPAR